MNEVLHEKEQLQILRKYYSRGMTLIQFTVNMPGPDKEIHPGYELAILGIESLISHFAQNNVKMKDMMFKNTAIGIVGLFNTDEEANYMKQMCINIEQNHLLGKYWDIDIFNKAGEKISRKMLHMPPRKCFICDNPAKKCAFLKLHTIKDLVDKIIADFNEYIFLRLRDNGKL